jgi:hypothetical protein
LDDEMTPKSQVTGTLFTVVCRYVALTKEGHFKTKYMDLGTFESYVKARTAKDEVDLANLGREIRKGLEPNERLLEVRVEVPLPDKLRRGRHFRSLEFKRS